MKSTSASGATIRFVDRGAGEPALLLMAGWCTDHTVFGDIVPKLAEQNHVLALDWRGHGESQHYYEEEFDGYEMTEDALAVIESSGVERVIPVALAHAGWVAIALRRRLGERVPKIVLMDWIVGEPPAEFLRLLQQMQTEHWREARDQIFKVWRAGTKNEEMERYFTEVVEKFDGAMWARAARMIGQAYTECGSPLRELSRLDPPVSVLHLYSQPADSGFAEMQAHFAASHPWYSYRKLPAKTHFAGFEVPDQIVQLITDFARREVRGKAA